MFAFVSYLIVSTGIVAVVCLIFHYFFGKPQNMLERLVIIVFYILILIVYLFFAVFAGDVFLSWKCFPFLI